MHTYLNAYAKVESGFSMSSSQEISSGSVAFSMIFQALQSEIPRFKFYSLCFKILEMPEFNLFIMLCHNLDFMLVLSFV